MQTYVWPCAYELYAQWNTVEMHKELVLARTRHPGMKYSFEKDHNSEERKKKRVTM